MIPFFVGALAFLIDFFRKPDQSARLISYPRLGGLHHRYDWRQAA